MSELKSNALRRGFVAAVILIIAGFIAFGRVPSNGFPFQRYDAHLHFAAFAAITMLAVIARPRTATSHLFVSLATLAAATELLQFIPSLNRTPSWSDFGFNISGIVAMLSAVAILRSKARR